MNYLLLFLVLTAIVLVFYQPKKKRVHATQKEQRARESTKSPARIEVHS